MKILIEWGGYHLGNVGDTAMLQVAIERLGYLYPDASITTFTTVPKKLAQYYPHVSPLSPSGRTIWFSPLISRFQNSKSDRAAKYWKSLELNLRKQSPSLMCSLFKLKLRKMPERAKDFESFMEAMYGADLVITTGGGYITDAFKHHAIAALDTLNLAIQLGKTTAMLGQGLGPIRDPELLGKAKEVLPAVSLIGLREKRAGLPLLNLVGVSQERVTITGDDAIELAYNARSTELGKGIGVNLRVSDYSSLNHTLLTTVRLTLQSAAKKYSAPLLPSPISHHYSEADSTSIRQLLEGYDDASDGGSSLDTPLKVIEQVGKCRVVVTGSYHAGVFALSQGIPVVGLAKSEYYIDKFLGLADQFGAGCQTILLSDQNLQEKLSTAINSAWNLSEQLRPQLLEAAKRQIDLGHTTYKKLYELADT